MPEKIDLFDGVEIEEITIEGQTVGFPMRFYNQTCISANFPAPTNKLKEILPSKNLNPIEVMPGTGIVSFMAFEHKKADNITPYNEFGTFIPVVYQKDGKDQAYPGLYSLSMPVNTEIARYGGVRIYGYSKIVAEVNFIDMGDMLGCNVWHDGKDVITLKVKKLETQKQTSEIYHITLKDETLIRTQVRFQGLIGASRDPDGATYELGNHELSRMIRSTGVGEKPLEYSYMPKLKSLLYKPGQFLEK